MFRIVNKTQIKITVAKYSDFHALNKYFLNTYSKQDLMLSANPFIMSVCDDGLIIGFLFPTKEYQERFLIVISYKSIVSEVVVEPIDPIKIASESLSICTYIHRTDNICFEQ